jgi:hypothetical protein
MMGMVAVVADRSVPYGLKFLRPSYPYTNKSKGRDTTEVYIAIAINTVCSEWP